ncbi:ATP-binding protein [Flavobacterium sp. NG2]|uniref:ATP-binding protein n=1 Tax=Flavobacterium sp. NG2 TaxID=3097547 RepID=UPI002A813186|nr:ATP-binding protein [Flavobacterium sp. NG2]WPR72885.1 ATP-binding protein [Flavobacterium sp. NG2]
MKSIRNTLFLFLLLVLSSTISFSQNDSILKQKAEADVKHATKLMLEGKHEESLIKSRQALKEAIALNDDNLIANSYNTIAANFDQLTEFEKAFFYYKKGLFYAERTNNNKLKNWLNNNLANIYCFDKKEYKKGIYHYKKSLSFSNKIKDSSQIIFTKLNITWAYFDIGQFENGLPYLNFINKYHPKHGNSNTDVALNMLNGMYHSHYNNSQKAIGYFEKAIRIGQKESDKSDLSFTHLEYSKFLSKTKNFQKAFENLERYNALTKEINNDDKLKKANVAGINLELDEYKREIDTIESKFKTKEQLMIENQTRNKRISIIIISALIIIIIIFYFFFQNTKLKQKNKLKDVQSKIQRNIINATVSGQELERKKIASFLHDNISALLSSADMHLSVFNAKNKIQSDELSKTKSILKEAHDKVRDLSHELIPSLLTRFGLYYALQDLCEKNSNSHLQFEYLSTINIKKRYNEDFELKMYFIITELLNNIIKHSHASQAQLNLIEKKDELLIKIIDNGRGFDTKKFNIIEGFGLNQIRARIKNMDGKIRIKSTINVGTTIHIKVPIAQKK